MFNGEPPRTEKENHAGNIVGRRWFLVQHITIAAVDCCRIFRGNTVEYLRLLTSRGRGNGALEL